jgi:autotransporter-associated beta strand protein
VGLRASTGTGGVTGEVHIGGGAVTFESIELARNSVAGSTVAQGLLNFHGGTIAMGGNIVRGGGAGPATAVLLMTNNATLDMNGYAIGSGASPIDILQLDSGTLRNVGEINGGAAWTKNGAGTLTIEGVNTYAGTLTAALGTLRYNGVHTGGGLITIQGGATLAGTGTVGAVTVDAGGLLSPGNSAGTLTVGDLTLDGGTLLYYELLTTGTSDLILAGTTILGGVDFDNFTFLPGVGFGPGVYTLIDATAISGLGAATTGTVGGYDAALSIDNDNQDLQLTVIPEPTTLALFALCAAAALLRRRMR